MLLDAYPNPFNAGALVTVTTARAGMIDVSVYDLLGRSVLTIVRGDVPAGTHVYSFDGSQFGSGVYFVRAEAPGAAATTAKLTLVR
ncbi:MAG: hypothetical protein MAG453_02011 [Calditrichaeota bacterium]|nr:hypothetical protein [Calditrichota bacterium]